MIDRVVGEQRIDHIPALARQRRDQGVARVDLAGTAFQGGYDIPKILPAGIEVKKVDVDRGREPRHDLEIRRGERPQREQAHAWSQDRRVQRPPQGQGHEFIPNMQPMSRAHGRQAAPELRLPVPVFAPLPGPDPLRPIHQIALEGKRDAPGKLIGLTLALVIDITAELRPVVRWFEVLQEREQTPGEHVALERMRRFRDSRQHGAKDIPDKLRGKRETEVGGNPEHRCEPQRQPLRNAGMLNHNRIGHQSVW